MNPIPLSIPERSRPPTSRWGGGLFYGSVLLVLLVLLGLPFVGAAVQALPRHVAVGTHAAVEMFCGITALLIAGLVLTLSRHYQERAVRVAALGFFTMGVLDVLHALTDPAVHPGWFVALHTASALSGGALLCLGAAYYYRDHRPLTPAGDRPYRLLFALGALGAIGLAYQWLLPHGGIDEFYGFSALARRAHEVSGLLYALAAVFGVLLYRATGQRLVIVAAGMLLLFAQSAYLFRFSHVWAPAWWTWHAVKAGFYIGILVLIAAGLVVALRAVERARASETATNRELRRAHHTLGQMHRELQARNNMVSTSISAGGLDQTLGVVETALAQLIGPCGCELLLCARADEVAEWQRDFERRGLRWPVLAASDDQIPCTELRLGGGSAHACAGDASPQDWVCLALRSHDQVFGAIHVRPDKPTALRRKSGSLRSLAAEIGPIVHNALLWDHRQSAMDFRSALSRVAGLMGSSLELSTVLRSVCRESAQFLGSDSTAVFMVEDSGAGRHLASHCVLGKHEQAIIDVGAALLGDSEPARGLLARLCEAGQPVALATPADPALPLPFPLEVEGCRCGALAVFPLFDTGELMALMVFIRGERIPFSGQTLENGELLAEQVRVAISNAKAYEDLQRSAERLRLAEEQRARAERLAMLGRMTASLAHEIRNPLCAITNCLGVLHRGGEDRSRAEKALQIIDDEVQYLERLASNMVSFGRPRRDTLSRIRLEVLAQHVCDGIVAHIDHEGLPVTVRLEARGLRGKVEFDADGFRQVLWNLLLNAVQATRGPGHIDVRLRRRGQNLFLAVADSGPGVPTADRTRIFEPFYTQRSQGAGLGLAVVRQHVDAWGGRLRIWGPPGTCFALRFRLPTQRVATATGERGMEPVS